MNNVRQGGILNLMALLFEMAGDIKAPVMAGLRGETGHGNVHIVLSTAKCVQMVYCA